MYVCMYVSMYVCMYVCMYIYTYINKHTHTHIYRLSDIRCCNSNYNIVSQHVVLYLVIIHLLKVNYNNYLFYNILVGCWREGLRRYLACRGTPYLHTEYCRFSAQAN